MTQDGVGFRPEGAGDEGAGDADIVRRAHVAHRAASFAPLGWPAEALARLCEQQHDLQERHIAACHPHAERRMVVAAGRAIGRMVVDTTHGPWRIVDIALLPEAQGRGRGGAALHALIAEASAAGAAIDLTVGRDNPRAEALYRRLGFVDAPDASDSHIRLIRPCRDR